MGLLQNGQTHNIRKVKHYSAAVLDFIFDLFIINIQFTQYSLCFNLALFIAASFPQNPKTYVDPLHWG